MQDTRDGSGVKTFLRQIRVQNPISVPSLEARSIFWRGPFCLGHGSAMIAAPTMMNDRKKSSPLRQRWSHGPAPERHCGRNHQNCAFFFAPCRFGGLCLSNTGHGAIIPSRCVLFGSRFSGLVGRDFFGDRRIALQGDNEQACNDRHHCCNAHRELIAVLLDQDG